MHNKFPPILSSSKLCLRLYW